MGEKTLNDLGGTVREVSLRKGNLGRSRSIKELAMSVGAGHGATGAIARGHNPDRGAASMNGKESLANSRNHSGLVLE